jgi:hypothetical protein
MEPFAALSAVRDLEERCALGDPSVPVERVVTGCVGLGTVFNRTVTAETEAMAARLLQRHPDHPRVRLLSANRHASARRWVEAGAALAGVDSSALVEVQAQHVHHLRALAALHERRLDRVAAEVEQARKLRGHCSLRALAELAGKGALEDDGDDGIAVLQRLHEVIRTADHRLAAGDPEGAIAALERPEVWAAHELQSLARLAEAHLRAPPAAGRARVRRLEALGVLADELDEHGALFRQEALCEGAWTQEQLDDVRARALSWLAAPPRASQ